MMVKGMNKTQLLPSSHGGDRHADHEFDWLTPSASLSQPPSPPAHDQSSF